MIVLLKILYCNAYALLISRYKMKKYMIWYTGAPIEVDDIVYADNKVDAIKQFIIRNKGKFNVVMIKEIY